MIETMRSLLMYVVMPLWLIADVVDWNDFRNADTEYAAGTRESTLHILLILEMAIPLAAAAFFDINAAVFVIASIALLIHQFIVYVDLKHGHSRRTISLPQLTHRGVDPLYYGKGDGGRRTQAAPTSSRISYRQVRELE